MVRYQRQLDATDARLTQSQKMLSQIVDSNPVRSSQSVHCHLSPWLKRVALPVSIMMLAPAMVPSILPCSPSCRMRSCAVLARVAMQVLGQRAKASGYKGSFAPSPQLSDDALRSRKSNGTAAEDPDSYDARDIQPVDASQPEDPPQATLEGPPTFGPLLPELNKTVGALSSHDESAPSPGAAATAWPTGDRRSLGGFDARFHSTNACAAIPSSASVWACVDHVGIRPLHDRSAACRAGLILVCKSVDHTHRQPVLPQHVAARVWHTAQRGAAATSCRMYCCFIDGVVAAGALPHKTTVSCRNASSL